MKFFDPIDMINDIFEENFDPTKHLKKITRENVLKCFKNKKTTLPLSNSFLISENVIEEENWAKLPPKVKNELIDIYHNIKKINDDQIQKLVEYQNKYSNVPAIINYLTNAYFLKKEYTKHYESIQETIKKFPDYLFGKIALADYYRNNNEIPKIIKSFNDNYEIYTLSPRENNIYHTSEIRGFYLNIGHYYSYKNKIEEALLCYLLLKDLDEEHISTQTLGKYIYSNELKKIFKKIKSNMKK